MMVTDAGCKTSLEIDPISRRRCQSHLERRPLTRRTQTANRCAGALTGFGDYRQTKSASRPLGPRSAPEPLKQVRPVRFGNAGTVVGDPQCSVAREGDGYLRAHRRMGDRVLNEVARDFGYRFLGG